MQNSNLKLFVGLVLGALLGAAAIHFLRPSQTVEHNTSGLGPNVQAQSAPAPASKTQLETDLAQGSREFATPKAHGLSEASVSDAEVASLVGGLNVQAEARVEGTGAIHGVVTDPDGAPVKGVTHRRWVGSSPHQSFALAWGPSPLLA